MPTLFDFEFPVLLISRNFYAKMKIPLVLMRVLCSGKTLAFQANDAGSIPATRLLS